MLTEKKIKKLVVTTPQGLSGILQHDSRFVFNYTTGDRHREVSLVMPIRAESYASGTLPGVFVMNRPEGFLLEQMISRFAKHGGLDDMKMLSLVGDNQIGRLRFSEEQVSERKKIHRSIGLSELLSMKESLELFEFLVETWWQSGISGVQPKVLVPDSDNINKPDSKMSVVQSDLIVKSGGYEYPHLAENEFLCMSAAARSGIHVPAFWLSADGGLFIMKRFDLQDGKQLGFEDMMVLTGKQPDREGHAKYQSSYENIAKAVILHGGLNAQESLGRLFEYVALSVMVRNGDAHLKNFGMLYDHPGSENPPVISPLYDVVTTTVYSHTNERTGVSKVDRTMALKMSKNKGYPDRAALLRYGKDICHVARPEDVIDRIAQGMTQALEEEAKRIDKDFVLEMRREWDAGRMSVEPTRVFTAHSSLTLSNRTN